MKIHWSVETRPTAARVDLQNDQMNRMRGGFLTVKKSGKHGFHRRPRYLGREAGCISTTSEESKAGRAQARSVASL